MKWTEYLGRPQNMIEHRSYRFDEVKTHEGVGRFTGRASVFGVVDLVGEVVEPGAFTTSLSEQGNVVKVLAQHDVFNVIGKATLTETDTSLEADGILELDLSSASDMMIRLKAGLIDGISIGYEVVKDKFEQGVRKLLEIRLWEISLVTFPANPLARVTGVKAVAMRLETMMKSEPTPEVVSQVRDLVTSAIGDRKSLDAVLGRLDVMAGEAGGDPTSGDDEDLARALAELASTVTRET